MKKRILTSLFISALCGNTFASSNYSLSTNLELPDVNAERTSNLSGDFGITSNQLVDDVGEVPGNYYWGEANIKYEKYTQSDQYWNINFGTRVNDQEEMMISLREGYWQMRFQNSTLSAGRKILNWSHADKIWGLGKVNNRTNFDYFEPGQEGLTGINFQQKFKNGFSYGAFISGLYVPELNPSSHYDESEGKVTCKNPWCKAPNETAPVEGKDIPIFYNVNYPEPVDIAMRASAGLKIGQEFEVINMSDLHAKLSVSGFYLRKPENQIATTVEVKYQTDESRIFVDVTPQVFYHDVKGANIELDIQEWNLKLYGSTISTVPEKRPDNEDPYIEYLGYRPKKLQEDYLSSGLIFNDGDFEAHLGYIARVSDFDRENELLAEYPRWNQAVHLAAQKNLTRNVFVSLDYKYDMLTEDRLTMFNSSYRFGPSMVGSLGVNIIGTNPDEESFWSDFENNDAVYSSVKYTF